MAYVPVVLEFSTDTQVETVPDGWQPIHQYHAAPGYKIINWGFMSSVMPGVTILGSAISGDGDDWYAEISNGTGYETTITYTFTLLKV